MALVALMHCGLLLQMSRQDAEVFMQQQGCPALPADVLEWQTPHLARALEQDAGAAPLLTHHALASWSLMSYAVSCVPSLLEGHLTCIPTVRLCYPGADLPLSPNKSPLSTAVCGSGCDFLPTVVTQGLGFLTHPVSQTHGRTVLCQTSTCMQT